MTATNRTLADLLRGTRTGEPQSVGTMDVIPLLLDEPGAEHEDFGDPAELEVSVPNDYGHLGFQNEGERPVIVPGQVGYVTKSATQDHALPGAALVPAKSTVNVHTAACIQSSQSGLMKSGKHEFFVMPATLREAMIATRRESSFDRLWPSIDKFGARYDARLDGHFVRFLTQFKSELDSFVAQFECVPGQIGAVVAVGGRIVGIERAPSRRLWQSMWVPLIRVCYGSLAVEAAQRGAASAPLRVPVEPASSFEELHAHTKSADERAAGVCRKAVEALGKLAFESVEDSRAFSVTMLTGGNETFVGHSVQRSDGRFPYTSLIARGIGV